MWEKARASASAARGVEHGPAEARASFGHARTRQHNSEGESLLNIRLGHLFSPGDFWRGSGRLAFRVLSIRVNGKLVLRICLGDVVPPPSSMHTPAFNG